jgi:hypothetical protein
MKSISVRILFALTLLVTAALACGGSFSTANISNAYTTADPGGAPTTVFAQDQIFYCIIELKNAPDDTVVKVVWTAVNVENANPNTFLYENSLTGGDNTLTYQLSNDGFWPVGTYKADIYLNDTLDRTLEFEVR